MDKDWNKEQTENDIAIRHGLPVSGGCERPAEFWEFLLAGGDGIVEVPPDCWKMGYYDADKEKPGKMYVNRGGFIRGIDQFDPQFFGISPKDAPHIDPLAAGADLLGAREHRFEGERVERQQYGRSQFMRDYEQVQPKQEHVLKSWGREKYLS